MSHVGGTLEGKQAIIEDTSYKRVFWLALAISYAIIVDKYLYPFFKSDVLSIPIIIAEWCILLVLVHYFMLRHGRLLPRLLIILFAAKIIIVAAVLNDFSFQKNILILFALMVYTFRNQEFRRYCAEQIGNHYVKLIVLLVVSFLVFAPFYNRHFAEVEASSFEDIRRLSGLWDLPHSYAYFVLALMALQRKENLPLTFFLAMNVFATGVRSAMIATLVYLAHILLLRVPNPRQLFKRIAVIGVAGLFALTLTGLGGFLEEQYEFHIVPLIEEDISDPHYGKGRFIYNFIALNDMRTFSTAELWFGRSATSLYSAFEEAIGMIYWPHNDYVTVVYIYGILGLAMYLYIMHGMPLIVTRFSLRSKVFIITLVVAILSMTNGYYTYHALYLFAIANAIHIEEYLTEKGMRNSETSEDANSDV